MRTVSKIIALTALALLIHSAPAAAQFLSFVSATGNDANTCFVQANPCLTLQRGINVTSAGGEVRVLSQLTGNGFINKSITIEGGGNTIIGTISVNSASAIVTFRGLGLNGRHAFATGFNLINAAAVHIENSTVERYAGDGIFLASGVSTELFVSDSVSRDNGDSGLEIAATAMKLTVDNSRFENNGFGGLRVSGGSASVQDSAALGNSYGILLHGGTANFIRTTAATNAFAGFGVDGLGEMTLESCVARGNASGGLLVGDAASARISNFVSTNNNLGIDNSSGGSVLTLGNNVIAGNTTDDVAGTLTTLTPQ